MKKIFVGLSGGVDSAVSAALLKEAGHDVVGVFIKIWSPEFIECTWREDRLDAMRVAVSLGIPFKEIDLSSEYKDSVIKDMIEQYSHGYTPNPDVLCNRTIKFGAFQKWALDNGADAIATGHYARVVHSPKGHQLLKGIDPAKDQSYFLYRLNQSDLSTTFFPVGGFKKTDIRAKAKSFGLPNAERPDSQGLCFVGDVSMQEFLSRFIDISKGPLISKGIQIGEHDGAALYTVGQRHGFHLWPHAPSGPYYVTSVDTATNTVQVSREKIDTTCIQVRLRDLHWVREPRQSAIAVPRYHSAGVGCSVEDTVVTFETALQVTKGQSLVLYDTDECLGGGIVAETHKTVEK